MEKQPVFQEIDYLIMGHVTVDVTPDGERPGGTASYASLLVSRLGLRVGLVTAYGGDLPPELAGVIHVHQIPAENNTTFTTSYRNGKRQLVVLQKGPTLTYHHIPPPWRTARLVHLGPVAGELDSDLPGKFPHSKLGITPQGWLRGWDEDGRVRPIPGKKAAAICAPADAVVISEEDVGESEKEILRFADCSKLLIATRGYRGARLYTGQDTIREISAPGVEEVDPTGAGDVFAAGFFVHYFQSGDPLQAARFATALAVCSVTREGLAGVPSAAEIRSIQEDM